jgi:hypothetical protein
VISNVQVATFHASRRLSDLIPRALRPVIAVGISLVVVASPGRAGAAEVRTYRVYCQNASTEIAQLVPTGQYSTNLVIDRGEEAVTFRGFPWPSTTDGIASHVAEVLAALREFGIGGCEFGRIDPEGGDASATITYPAPAGVSAYVDSTLARSQAQWTPADIAHLVQRGQARLVIGPDRAVAGAVVFFSAWDNTNREVALLYAWSGERGRYELMAQTSAISQANFDAAGIQAVLIEYVGKYLQRIEPAPPSAVVGAAAPPTDLPAALAHAQTYATVAYPRVLTHAQAADLLAQGDCSTVYRADSKYGEWDHEFLPETMGLVCRGNDAIRVWRFDQELGYELVRAVPTDVPQSALNQAVAIAMGLPDGIGVELLTGDISDKVGAVESDSAEIILIHDSHVERVKPDPFYVVWWWRWNVDPEYKWWLLTRAAVPILLVLTATVFAVRRMRAAWKLARERRRLSRVQRIQAFMEEKKREIGVAKWHLQEELKDLVATMKKDDRDRR